MKRLFLSLLISFCTLCMAQTNHMKFKGIPMEGTVESFVKKLEAKGYTYLGQSNGQACLLGDFAIRKDCGIAVTSENGVVKEVAVLNPAKENWADISREYYILKDMLTEKYGKPESMEEFHNGDCPTDLLKFLALVQGECTFASRFSCNEGYVMLSMKGMGDMSAIVTLLYQNKSDIDDSYKRAMDDL